jgi:hypothetical protein
LVTGLCDCGRGECYVRSIDTLPAHESHGSFERANIAPLTPMCPYLDKGYTSAANQNKLRQWHVEHPIVP